MNYKAFVLEQANLADARGPDWKVWEDESFPSRDMPPHEAAKCAALQGEEAFAKYHIMLHRARHKDKKDITNQLILRDLAIEVGLDVARWEEDMKSGATVSLIAQDHEEGAGEYGVFGVPTLLFQKGKAVFAKLEEGEWEGTDDKGLLDAVIAASADRPYLLELKTPESARLAEASRKKYQLKKGS